MIKVSEYFDGRVKSLGQELAGQRFTVGIIEPGEYTFGTQTLEIMEVIYGEMDVVHPDGRRDSYRKGQSFQVPRDTKFTVTARQPVTYLCLYQ